MIKVSKILTMKEQVKKLVKQSYKDCTDARNTMTADHLMMSIMLNLDKYTFNENIT